MEIIHWKHTCQYSDNFHFTKIHLIPFITFLQSLHYIYHMSLDRHGRKLQFDWLAKAYNHRAVNLVTSCRYYDDLRVNLAWNGSKPRNILVCRWLRIGRLFNVDVLKFANCVSKAWQTDTLTDTDTDTPIDCIKTQYWWSWRGGGNRMQLYAAES